MNAHWILYLYKLKEEEKYTSASLHCSNCKDVPIDKSFYPIREHYCHNCGAHMIEKPTIIVNEWNKEDYLWEKINDSN